MDMGSVQIGGTLAYTATNPFADASAIDDIARGGQNAAINPADRVQSISLDGGMEDGDYGITVETGYSYGPFYTNRLLYLDIQAELMVVQFRDALDREVRLQFPPELTLKAYRNTTPQNQAETSGNEPEAQAQQQLPAPIAKPANDGLNEALFVGSGTTGSVSDKPTVPALASTATDTPAKAPAVQPQPASATPVPGQIVELVA